MVMMHARGHPVVNRGSRVSRRGEEGAETRKGIRSMKPDRLPRAAQNRKRGAPGLREILCCDSIRHEEEARRLPGQLCILEGVSKVLTHRGELCEAGRKPEEVIGPGDMGYGWEPVSRIPPIPSPEPAQHSVVQSMIKEKVSLRWRLGAALPPARPALPQGNRRADRILDADRERSPDKLAEGSCAEAQGKTSALQGSIKDWMGHRIKSMSQVALPHVDGKVPFLGLLQQKLNRIKISAHRRPGSKPKNLQTGGSE